MPEDPEKLIEAMCEWVEKCTVHNHELKKEIEDLEEQLETAASESEESLNSLLEDLEDLVKKYQ